MSAVKGKIEASITLSRSTCYFMRTGRCSLDIVTDYYVATSTRTSANDLLYCPRLFRAMRNRERMKPISVTPCECGHAEVVSGHQRACIASRENLELVIQPAGPEVKAECPICGGQLTFEENGGGSRIVALRVRVEDDGT
ncbi:MAG TPA: hypothetical protein H9684_03390 [Firmicutes bacterium]|nr:hypothetical protein [Bacillota bacterium]